MFSKTSEYAIRAIVYISSQSNTGVKVGIQQICEQIEAPHYFTAKILQTLSRSGIVSSQKGVHGGFYITAEQAQLPLIRIVMAIDGPKIFTGCGLGLKQCSESNPCPIHDDFKAIRNNLKHMMEHTTILDMALKVRQGTSVLKTLA